MTVFLLKVLSKIKLLNQITLSFKHITYFHTFVCIAWMCVCIAELCLHFLDAVLHTFIQTYEQCLPVSFKKAGKKKERDVYGEKEPVRICGIGLSPG